MKNNEYFRDFNEFYGLFLSELEKKLKPGETIREFDMPKNNYTAKAVAVEAENGAVSPVLYPEQYYEEWEESSYSFDAVMDGVFVDMRRDIMSQAEDIRKHILSGNTEYLRSAVASYQGNEEWLDNIPHEKVADLAVYAKWRISENMSTKVTCQMMASMHMTKEELLAAAKKNTEKESQLVPIGEVLRKICTDNGMPGHLADEVFSEKAPMWVLTNSSNQDGASMIASPEILKKARETIGEDFLILPSSVHEVLLIPKEGCEFGMEELKGMVRMINRAEVPLEDRLSDQVYEFDGHTLTLAGAGHTKDHSITDTVTHKRGR